MARLFSIRPALTFRGRKFKGLRGFAGKPFHPPLTDIPVACYFLVAFFDLISFFASGDTSRNAYVAGTFTLISGFIISIPTALTGFWDWLRSMTKHTQAWRTANWHMAVMLTTTAVVIVELFVRLPRADAASASGLVTILSLIVSALVSFGAAYGGTLVYEYGFNVETAGDSPVWHESETDVFPGDK